VEKRFFTDQLGIQHRMDRRFLMLNRLLDQREAFFAVNASALLSHFK
jgi:hypothetical protein